MKHLGILLFALATLAGCGPEKSQMDLDRETQEAKSIQKAQENARLVGYYKGQVLYNGIEIGKIAVEIYAQDMVTKNPSDVDPKFIPTLRGYLVANIPLLQENGLEPADGIFDTPLTTIAFDGTSKVSIQGFVPGTALEVAFVSGSFNGSDTIEGYYYSLRGIDIPGLDKKVSFAKVILKKI